MPSLAEQIPGGSKWYTGRWQRVCQSCNHKQYTKAPPEDQSSKAFNTWCELKCTKCKSESLDFGSAELTEYANKRNLEMLDEDEPTSTPS